ncbi:DUF3592 domain-containing protein [Devosia sp. SL43]|uniref:DUF3592 domain-containing protein n=1 Tax=Devosia sp. SL43 TaxID=2806348 RepID=UPI001F4158DF|nr:DUF3592 domain-containing protein [Devosia sp. SL43]UJW87254.1 hypothetical protein IM737_08450 [Devosia sp. SL43]
MISLMRYCVSLALGTMGALAGLGVLAYGLVHFVGALFIATTMAGSDLPHSGFRGDMATLVVAQHLLPIMFGIAIVAVAVAFMLARIRAGLPDDEEGVGTTTPTRLLSLCIYSAGTLYGAYGLTFGIGPLVDDYRLAEQGRTVVAQILSAEPAPDIGPDIRRIHYQFLTEDGQIVTGTANQFEYTAPRTVKAGAAEVTYDPLDPSRSELDFSFSLQFALYFVAAQLVFLILGIWGFAKSAQALRDSIPPPAAPTRPVRPPVISASPVAAPRSTARGQFGRRGT